jgi:hypothetical protein
LEAPQIWKQPTNERRNFWVASARSRSFSELEDARAEFENLFGDELRSGGYTQFTPTHVLITGCLFYDIDHPAGAVGPRDHAPATAWEIHPITSITPTD